MAPEKYLKFQFQCPHMKSHGNTAMVICAPVVYGRFSETRKDVKCLQGLLQKSLLIPSEDQGL